MKSLLRIYGIALSITGFMWAISGHTKEAVIVCAISTVILNQAYQEKR